MTLRELFDEEYERLATYLARHSSPETGEDLASEAFTKLASRRWSAPLSAELLWRVALDGLTDWGRNGSTRPDILTTHPQEEGGTSAFSFAPLDSVLFRTDFDRAFRALPQPYAEAFALVELRGLTVREAASFAGISRPTIARRALLARSILKEELA